MVVIEQINSRDMPGFFLNRTTEARRAIEAVGARNLKLQLDLYHCQIMEGDLAIHIRDCADITGHIQIAGVPERHEPDIGEINYPYLFEAIDHSGYDGWIGCEYRPRGATTAGLGWFAPYRQRA
jgi:hydroxypyruvate isomerase